MKHLLAAALSLPLGVFAQDELTVTDTLRSFSKGSYNSYLVTIPGAKLNDIQKSWNSYLKPLSKNKPVELNGEVSLAGATVKNVSPAPFNIYSKLLETSKGVQITTWLTPNDTLYLSKDVNADQNTAAEKFTRDFAVAEYQKLVKVDLDGAKAVQKKQESDLADLIKDQEKNVKKINENNRSIGRNQDAITANETDQNTKSSQITQQKGVVDNAKKGDPEILKVEQKHLKDYNSDLKKLQNENEKLHKAIDGWNKEIRDYQRNIDQSQKDQEALKAQIETQKSTVQVIQNKLANIK